MKNLMLLSGLMILLATNVKGQSVEWTSDLVDVLYAGYNNVLPLKFVDVDASKVKLSVTGGELAQNDKGRYIWTSNTGGHHETLTAKVGDQIIGSFNMKFVRFPDPVAVQVPANTTAKNLREIRCILPNVKLNLPAVINSYAIQITNNGDMEILKNKGGKLTENNRRLLKYVSPKASVVITEIKARCPGDVAGRRLNDIQLQ